MSQIKQQLHVDVQDKECSDKMENIINEIILNAVDDLVYLMKVDNGTVFSYFYANKAGYKHANISHSSLGLTLQEVLSSSLAELLQEKYEMVVQNNVPLTFQDAIQINDEEIIGESILTPFVLQGTLLIKSEKSLD